MFTATDSRCHPTNKYIPDRRIAYKQTYSISKARTNYGIFNIRFSGVKVWNPIHADSKKLSIKGNIKKHFFQILNLDNASTFIFTIDIFLFIYLFIYLFTYVCMYVCMYVCTYVRMYVCMYVCMYVLFIHLFIYLFIYLLLFIYLSINQIQLTTSSGYLARLTLTACSTQTQASAQTQQQLKQVECNLTQMQTLAHILRLRLFCFTNFQVWVEVAQTQMQVQNRLRLRRWCECFCACVCICVFGANTPLWLFQVHSTNRLFWFLPVLVKVVLECTYNKYQRE